ncbi:MAG: histidine kinase [Candidatus Nanohaloarchaea archaeon]
MVYNDNMDIDNNDILSGALAGAIGTAAFGAFFLAIGNKAVIAGAIPGLYGIQGPSLVIGGLIHIIHGAILGVIYTAIVSGAGYKQYLTDLKSSFGLGIGYGVLTTGLAVFLMPVWLSTVGFPKAPSVPNFSPMGLAGHVIYGLGLAVAYSLIREQLE